MVKKLLLSAALAASVAFGVSAKTTVLFEGPANIADEPYNNWYPGIEIPKASIVDAGEGAVLSFDVSFDGEGYSYKLSTGWTNDVIPSFTQIEGYNEQYSTLYTTAPTVSFTFTKEDIEFLAANGDGNLHISGAGNGGNMIVSNVSLTVSDAPAGEDIIKDITIDFGEGGWKTTYDVSTMTITFNEAWAGCGQWLNNADWSNWDQLVIEIEPVDFNTQLVVQYEDGKDGENQSSGVNQGKAIVNLDPDKKKDVRQYYLQSSQAGSVVLKKVYLVKKAEGAENVLWEGEMSDSWGAFANMTADMAAKQLIPGTILEITVKDAKEGNQMLLKNGEWNDLTCVFKGVAAVQEEEQTIELGISTEAYNVIKEKGFMIQSDGVTALKVVKSKKTFDAEAYTAYGPVYLGASLKLAAPLSADDDAYIDAVFDKQPEWIQLCTSAWANQEVEPEYTTNEDNTVTARFALTDAVIEALGDAFVLNGDNNALLYGVTIVKKDSAVDAIQIDNSNAPVEFYNLQGVKVNIDNAATGVYIRRQGSEAKKVLIRK